MDVYALLIFVVGCWGIHLKAMNNSTLEGHSLVSANNSHVHGVDKAVKRGGGMQIYIEGLNLAGRTSSSESESSKEEGLVVVITPKSTTTTWTDDDEPSKETADDGESSLKTTTADFRIKGTFLNGIVEGHSPGNDLKEDKNSNNTRKVSNNEVIDEGFVGNVGESLGEVSEEEETIIYHSQKETKNNYTTIVNAQIQALHTKKEFGDDGFVGRNFSSETAEDENANNASIPNLYHIPNIAIPTNAQTITYTVMVQGHPRLRRCRVGLRRKW